jgi:peptidoglycan/LPS O-acetylase OafA/YrhL
MSQFNAGTQTSSPVIHHLSAFDGVRGLLAIWVYLGHLANAVGLHQYVLAAHALAVDFFMIISGFLMVYTWKTNLHENAFDLKTTLRFYVNRFFRIAPLYYLLLLICYLALPTLSLMQTGVLKAFPPIWAESIPDYTPGVSWSFDNLRWLILHLSFGFGLVPGMEASTPLPDWSLSLEMQFYLILPLLLLLFSRIPIFLLALGAALLAIGSPSWFGNYLEAGSLAHFGQPSVLTYRLNAFIAGMLLGYFLRLQTKTDTVSFSRRTVYLLICAIICVLPLNKLVAVGFFCLAALAIWRIPFATAIFSHPSLRWAGDISYSVYLSHLLVVIPVIYWLTQHTYFMSLTVGWRFALAIVATGPCIFIISYCLYKTTEQPGIKVGRWLAQKI